MANANAQPVFIKANQGYHDWLSSYHLDVPNNIANKDLIIFNAVILPELLRVIKEESEQLGPLKFKYTIVANIKKLTNEGEVHETCYLHQEAPILSNAFNQKDVERKLKARINELKEKLAEWTERGSGWIYNGLKSVYLDFSRNDPIRGGSYIPLPPKLKAKQAIINVKNKDDDCIKWALKAAFFPVDETLAEQANTQRKISSTSLEFLFQHL